MGYIYLFDVDGTLTPPRRPMIQRFANFFQKFAGAFDVYLVSGSTYEMIRQQVPEPVILLCRGVFGSSGCEYYEKNHAVFKREHTFQDDLLQACEQFVTHSQYPHKFGNHVEHRTGMINVSSVGRNATVQQRDTYYHWDVNKRERENFARRINYDFPEYEASVGGEISVDIVPEGWNKSTVKQEVLARNPNASLCFFGDRMGQDGNDYPLAEALKTPSGKHRSVAVKTYKDTETHLRNLMSNAKD